MNMWNLSDVFVVRHAGFPFDLVESLGFSVSLQDLLEQTCDAEDQLIQLTGGERERQRVRDELIRGQEPRAPKNPPIGWTEKLITWRNIRQILIDAYQHEYTRLRERLHSFAAAPAFQEAVFLSNPSFYENVLHSFLAKGVGPASAENRRVERQIYKYFQRFCGKNETTSFFGPIAYGKVEDSDTQFKLSSAMPVRRCTTLSYWALRELDRAICRETALRPHIPLWRNPLFHFDGTSIGTPAQEMVEDITPLASRLFALLEDQSLSLAEASRVFKVELSNLLRAAIPLLRRGALLMEISIPRDGSDGLKALLTYVQELLPIEAAQQIWLERLQRLDALRELFEQATFEERRRLLPQMEELFTEWTGKPARRKTGQIYADRLIINEEASSPFSISIGQHMLDEIARCLSPALDLSAAYGTRVQHEFKRQMLAILPEDGSPMNFLDYASRARPDGDVRGSFAPFPELIVPVEGHAEASIAADCAGPPGEDSRYALPDICLAASSPEALAIGQADVMLSRVHHHLMIWGWLAMFYPDRSRYEAASTAWLRDESTAARLISLEVDRRNKGFYSFPGPCVALTTTLGDRRREAILPAQLTVHRHPSGPQLRDAQERDCYLYLPLADFIGYAPFAALAHPLVLHAPITNTSPETPRIRVGAAIYQRRRWRTNLSSMMQVRGVDLALAVWRCKRSHHWPRFVFARTPLERKPWLFDLASPFAHELTCNMIQADSTVLLEEMLPGPDQLWLQDDKGQRYTSELRLQAHRFTQSKS